MSAHTQVRFNKFEIQLRTAAEKILADPAATVANKRQARRDMHDALRAAQQRHLVKRAKDALGPQPKREDFATEAEYVQARESYRTGLDKIACDEILDNPNPLPKRNLARRVLADIERKERLTGIAPAVHAPRNAKPADAKPASPVPQAEPQRPAEEQAAIDRFFGEGESSQAEPRIVPNGPLRPQPPNTPLFCEVHQGPLSICGCANNEICSQCLIPRKNCGHR
jgi:hypothetical protein